jgi:hypothetical protein
MTQEEKRLNRILLEVVEERDFYSDVLYRIYKSKYWKSLPKDITDEVLLGLVKYAIEDE